MHLFRNGTYRGHRPALLAGHTTGAHESYRTYTVEVVGTANDGAQLVRVNGGRAHKVHAHSDGNIVLDGTAGRVSAAAATYAPNYIGRYLVDEVTISADPQFLVEAA